ncbi:MAG: alpha/beta hydrolase [Prevotellaceae bacterium]|jgi:pimeloyl-ACP methyl ester carboxylesterase|nr:alpha/beta hydrolase [Prevotellaceae bacterium]
MKKIFLLSIVAWPLWMACTTQPRDSKLFNHRSGDYLEMDGAAIYYEQIKNEGKPVLLFLHGGFGDIEDFNPIVSLFCDDFHIIGMDSRGQGKSTLGTDKLTYERLQLDVEGLLNHLQIKQLSIIGYSDGGIIGYRLAKAGISSIRKLITIGATWSLEDIELTKELFAELTPETCRVRFAKKKARYEKNNPSPDFDKLATLLLEMWVDETASGYPYENIETITVPTLIVRGNDDDLFTLESGVALSKKIKNSIFFNIPFAPHGAFRSHPEIFEIVVKQFLTT